MKKVLITGATGNVGREVLHYLLEMNCPLEIYAGVQEVKKSGGHLPPGVRPLAFDFQDPTTQAAALSGCDLLFLIRPPQLADVKKYFLPLIGKVKQAQVKHIVFLSVQGVEKSRLIPHHQIEQLIVDSGIPFTFLRPAYFMQNFSITLRDDLVSRQRIFLPAGKAKFALVDVRDIGKVAACVIRDSERHANQAYDLTSRQKLTFQQMVDRLTAGLGRPIRYQSPSLLKFYLTKRKEGQPADLILVMIPLHFLPRFQAEPLISDYVERITGMLPFSFEQFISDHKLLLQTPGQG